jgi:chromatin remodeling complex protein RSC6
VTSSFCPPDSEDNPEHTRPTKLSPAMCEFLDVATDTLMTPFDIIRRINQYIKRNNLQDSQDRRYIIPDAKLSALLSDTQGVNYFTGDTSIYGTL